MWITNKYWITRRDAEALEAGGLESVTLHSRRDIDPERDNERRIAVDSADSPVILYDPASNRESLVRIDFDIGDTV